MEDTSHANLQDTTDPIESETDHLKSALDNLMRLSRSANRIIRSDSMDKIWEIVMDEVAGITGSEEISLYLPEPGESGEDTLTAFREDQPDLLSKLDREDERLIQWATKENRITPVPIDESADEPEIIYLLPFKAEDTLLGVLLISLEESPQKIHQHLNQQLQFLSNQASATLHNLKLRQMVQDQNEKLEANKNKLTHILESINAGIIVVDEDNRVQRYNRNITAILGVDSNEMLGEPILGFVGGKLMSVIEDILSNIRSRGFTMEKRVNKRISEDEEIPLAVGGAPLMSDNQREGIILLIRDMTASRELERLRKIDKMKSDFVANVSHELRTPLTSIKAYTDALTDMVEGDEKQEFLEVIDSESDRLLDLIDDLLNLSKIQSGEIDLERGTFSLEELIEQVVSNIKMHSTDCDLHITMETDSTEVFADRDKIEEVLDNLIGNAVKYSPDGGDVEIKLYDREHYVHVSISDNGIGMTEEETEKIFDQFYRGRSANKAQIQGTGLGLTITKNIVESHGGDIEVESEPDEGTTFTFRLPVEE